MNQETKHAINLLDEVYSIIMQKIEDKESNRIYRISHVQEILSNIDELQNQIEQL